MKFGIDSRSQLWLLCLLPECATEVLRSLRVDDLEDIIMDLNRVNCFYNISDSSEVDYIRAFSLVRRLCIQCLYT